MTEKEPDLEDTPGGGTETQNLGWGVSRPPSLGWAVEPGPRWPFGIDPGDLTPWEEVGQDVSVGGSVSPDRRNYWEDICPVDRDLVCSVRICQNSSKTVVGNDTGNVWCTGDPDWVGLEKELRDEIDFVRVIQQIWGSTPESICLKWWVSKCPHQRKF